MLMRTVIALAFASVISGQPCTENESKLWQNEYSFTSNMINCAVKGSGSGGATASCMVAVYNGQLTNGCAKCFGDTVDCGYRNCGNLCAKAAYSPDCLACTEAKGCNSALAQCTGFTQGPPPPTPPPSASVAPKADDDGTAANVTSTTKGGACGFSAGSAAMLLFVSIAATRQ